MHLNGLSLFLADAAAPATSTTTAAATTATTSTAAPGQPAQQPGLGSLLVPMAIFFVMIYFLMIRPQSQQRKQLAKTQDTLKAGDRVVTASGIVGTVISVKDRTVSLRSMDAKMEVTKSSVTEVLERGGDEKSEKAS